MTIGGYQISLSGDGGWFEGLLLLIVLFLAYRAYLPIDNPSVLHRMLLAVRAAALILLVTLVFAPRVVIDASGVRKPLIAVLVDDSESMRIKAGDRPRHAIVDSLLENGTFDALEDRARVRFYGFSETLEEQLPPDSSRWSGVATDLSTSLEQLEIKGRPEGLSGIFLLSDGAHNQGEAPTRSGPVHAPVFAVPIGDGEPPVDVAVSTVNHASLAYVGTTLGVDALVEVAGVDRREHTIRLYDGESVVATVPLLLARGEQEVRIPFVPTQAGKRILRVELPTLADEVETQNNTVLTEIEVLEGKASVLLAGAPSADFAYLRRIIEADSNTTVDVVFPDARAGWAFRVQQRLRNVGDYDLVILHDVPDALMTDDIETRLIAAVDQGIGLLIVGGEEALVDGWGAGLNELLPVDTRQGTYGNESVVAIPVAAPLHPIMAGLSTDEVADGWKRLPPLVSAARLSMRRDGQGHLLMKSDAGEPLAVAGGYGRGRVVVVGARSLSRQALLMWGVGATDRVVRTFWERAVRWLLTEGSVERLRVSTDRSVYRSGEPITIRAELYDALLSPVDGAEVTASVGRGNERRSALSGRGNGVYEARLPGLAQGEHTLTVAASVGDTEERVQNQVTVGRYSIEYERLLPNVPMLQEIVDRSGGQLVTVGELDAFLSNMKLSPQPYTATFRYQLWGHSWPLLVLCSLVAVEWFVRRRRGMV